MTLDYQIELTPLIRTGTYGDITDISDYVEIAGVAGIRRELDQGDYDIGVFNYGSINITLNNYDGKFNDRHLDARSIFPWYRDRAKIDISFIDSDSGETISFRGLIADRSTRQNLSQQTITFTLLSLDSIFQQISILSGSIIDDVSFSEALRVMLNVPFITTILNFDPDNINLKLDLNIDDGSKFDNLLVKVGLDKLLLASNSVLYIDAFNNIIVQSRDVNDNPPYDFFHNDQYKRDNIHAVMNLNSGLHRMFNSVLVNGIESKDQNSIDEFAVRQKPITLDFITDNTKSLLIAQSILSEFAIPKLEMEIVISTEIAKDILLLDRVTVSYKSVLQPSVAQPIPLYETDEYGGAYYPVEIGDIQLDSRIIYKIIGFFENTANFKVTLKLRDTGIIL